MRIFTPEGNKPAGGWPVFVWFHGGGCVMGGLGSENSFLSRCCRDAGAVVVTCDYRHAPENPYPAAVEDAVEAYAWIVSSAGQKELGIDVEKLVLGGLSA